MGKIINCFGCKTTWFAIKGADVNTILSNSPNLKNPKKTEWRKGLLEMNHSFFEKAFLSGEYEGWSFLIGLGLCGPEEPDKIVKSLLTYGAFAEEVCYFSSHRVTGAYAFGKAVHGKVVRLYCYLDEQGHVYKNMGEKTEAEKELGLNFPREDEEVFEDDFDVIDEEDVFRLAGKLSLSPDKLIGMEEQECIIADII